MVDRENRENRENGCAIMDHNNRVVRLKVKKKANHVSRESGTHVDPEIIEHIPTLPVKDGMILLDRNNPNHVAWMEEEGEEEELSSDE